MFYKLLAITLGFGLTAAMLLVIRQQRIDIAHEMARTHQRLIEYQTQLWRLRADVVRRCRPEDVREAVEQSEHTWQQMPLPPAPPQSRNEQQANPSRLAERAPRRRGREPLIEG